MNRNLERSLFRRARIRPPSPRPSSDSRPAISLRSVVFPNPLRPDESDAFVRADFEARLEPEARHLLFQGFDSKPVILDSCIIRPTQSDQRPGNQHQKNRQRLRVLELILPHPTRNQKRRRNPALVIKQTHGRDFTERGAGHQRRAPKSPRLLQRGHSTQRNA